jgi:hypothetical protein
MIDSGDPFEQLTRLVAFGCGRPTLLGLIRNPQLCPVDRPIASAQPGRSCHRRPRSRGQRISPAEGYSRLRHRDDRQPLDRSIFDVHGFGRGRALAQGWNGKRRSNRGDLSFVPINEILDFLDEHGRVDAWFPVRCDLSGVLVVRARTRGEGPSIAATRSDLSNASMATAPSWPEIGPAD